MAILALSGACAQPAARGNSFELCSDDPAYKSFISLDYASVRAEFDDYGRSITRCDHSGSVCIDFPFLLSLPPRLPTHPSETVRWSVGDDRFSLQLLPGAEDSYFLEVQDFKRGPEGRAIPDGKLFYTYSKDIGIITLAGDGDTPHGWVRCAGRMTFEDLRALSARLPAMTFDEMRAATVGPNGR